MLEDYKIKIRTGRAQIVDPIPHQMGISGKVIQKRYEYVETYKTKAGDLTPGEWRKRALLEIEMEGKMGLLERIKQHCREKCAWIHKDDEVEVHAIECLCSGAYRHWEDFDFEDDTIIWM